MVTMVGMVAPRRAALRARHAAQLRSARARTRTARHERAYTAMRQQCTRTERHARNYSCLLYTSPSPRD
eukprot:6670891-Alexandrium_andersonii.AAC.1